MADDLSKFRQKWLKELQESDKDSKSAGTSVLQQYDGPETRPERGDTHLEDLRSPETETSCDHYPQGKEQDPENRPQVLQVCENSSDLTATYYPFRILTSLLNRASTEEGPKRVTVKKTSNGGSTQENAAVCITPKRTYFSECADQNGGYENNSSKKARREEEETHSKDYLDLFIADLNEINEIPFFDTSLPREVAIKIFWHLDFLDLCRCAQVSKSWRSLAEDELLWCHICHALGFEKNKLTIHHSNWKSRVRQYTIINHILQNNWRNRTGKLHNLHHSMGGVLCAVHSYRSTVVAGYSNCQTKLWDAFSGETCIFQPSSTALIIDESEEVGTIGNEVLHVATCEKITAASYSHGFVDAWSNESGTEPVYTFTNVRQPTSLQLWENQHSAYLAVSNNQSVQVHTVRDREGCLKDKVQFGSLVKKTRWLQSSDPSALSSGSYTPTLAIATNYTVSVMAVYDREADGSFDVLELHNIIDAPVTCIDARFDPGQVVVGFTLNTGPAQYFRVNVYDIVSRKVSSNLTGHTACVLCINSAESPICQLVTGSRDRKVRVYDTRVTQSAMVTLMGHSAAVTTVQIDDWKVVSGDEAGFVCVWDQRMASKLWDMNNRHPVRYCHFDNRQLVVGHVPYVKQHYMYDDIYDTGLHQRHRGSLHVYDFLADQMTQGVPEICLSSYDEPQGYNYNIALAVPYDQV